MSSDPESFEIRVLRREAGDSWTDEAVVVIGGRDRLALVGRDPVAQAASVPGEVWVGRRPEAVIGPESPLFARSEPHDALVACCDCGIEDCGALIARIARRDDHVVWDRLRCRSGTTIHEPIEGATFVFDADQYTSAIRGGDEPTSSWEPTARRVAQLLTARAQGWRDDGSRIRFVGAWAHGDGRVGVQVVVGSRSDPDRAIVRRTFDLGDGEDAGSMVDRLMGRLRDGTVLDQEAADRRPVGRRPHQP